MTSFRENGLMNYVPGSNNGNWFPLPMENMTIMRTNNRMVAFFMNCLHTINSRWGSFRNCSDTF